MPRPRGYKHLESTREKIRESNLSFWKDKGHLRKGERNSFFGKNHSKETKARIRASEYHQNLKGENNPNWNNHKLKGHRLTELQCEKISLAKQGSNNPSWIDGRSYEPYPKEFTERLKNQIRKRDNYICQGCGLTQEENQEQYNRKLDVHHVDYNSSNCDKDNLISTCQRCNLKANTDRDYWYAYYTYLIQEKYELQKDVAVPAKEKRSRRDRQGNIQQGQAPQELQPKEMGEQVAEG